MSAAVELLPEAIHEIRSRENNHLESYLGNAIMEFEVPVSGHVTMKVYDIVGREMATLVSEDMTAGSYQVTWDAREAEAGSYWYSVQSKSFVTAGKFNLIK